ncbi:hypothetical protein [Enterococcus faecium]|uniref:hypothetical protein n=1 Tax=Enterococcus faecium TaxID=1352 RepID=UPI000BF15714|nr:hypothetical protein [Enterococcus faecium]PEH49568.1 hypothetical protein CRM75_01270 [Enterococcus faecium]
MVERINLDVMDKKLAIIKAIEDVHIFLNNNREKAEPKNFAIVLEKVSEIEDKVKQAFPQDEALDEVIKKMETEVNEQSDIIKKQRLRLGKSEDEQEKALKDDEYKGVIMDV